MPMTLSGATGHFCSLNLCHTHNSGNITCFNYNTFTHKHINWTIHAACDLNLIVKAGGLLKVTDSHLHWKSGNISETVLDRDVVTTGH